MAKKLAPLSVAKDKEAQKSWEDITTPYQLLLYIAQFLSVNLQELSTLDEIVNGESPPSDKTKIWIKTSDPIGIGLPVAGSYKMIYQYPVNIPFLWMNDLDSIPGSARPLNDGELDQAKLEKPDEDKANWIIIQAQLTI